jgi:hypothetical protein
MSSPPAIPHASFTPPTSASGPADLPPGLTAEDVAAASEHKGCPATPKSDVSRCRGLPMYVPLISMTKLFVRSSLNVSF